jgi:hypothetical protein
MPDSKSILGWSANMVVKFNIDSGKFETLTPLKPEEVGGSHWIGTTADGSPLRMLNRDSRQIYALQIEDR